MCVKVIFRMDIKDFYQRQNYLSSAFCIYQYSKRYIFKECSLFHSSSKPLPTSTTGSWDQSQAAVRVVRMVHSFYTVSTHCTVNRGARHLRQSTINIVKCCILWLLVVWRVRVCVNTPSSPDTSTTPRDYYGISRLRDQI